MIDTLPEIGTHARLAVERLRSNRRTLPCPGAAIPRTRCLKIFDPNPRAPWDFSFLQIRQEVGESAQMTLLMPLAGGGLRRIVSRVRSKSVERISQLEEYEAATLGAGFVSVGALEIHRFYSESRAHVYVARSQVQDYDADGRPIGAYRPIEPHDWPPLPERAGLVEQIRGLRSGPRGVATLDHLSAGVAFPRVRALEDGDFEVSGGRLHIGEGRAELSGLDDGLRIYTSFQDGIPTLLTNDYYLVTGGRSRRLFGERCAQRVARQVIEVYKKHHDDGLFRATSKLSFIRNELRVSETVWEDT